MDIQEIMAQAKTMQARMLELQEELGNEEISYSVGDGLVTITITGRKQPVGIKLSPSVMELADVGLLEDLIMLALNRAAEKADEVLSQRTEAFMAEMGLPAGLQLPG